METTPVQPQAAQAFGVSLRELARTGGPTVLQDCLRWLALRGLRQPCLFGASAPADKRKLQALRHLYDTGRRPLRSKSCRDKDPQLIASLLLVWLKALPEPMFPAALVPELVESQQSDFYEERVAAVRVLLKRAEPFVVEALFPLFELLHHYWINQADRDSSLQELGRLLAPAVFGTAYAHNLPAEDAGLLSDTVEMLISEYRPLFTQPFNLRRFEADSARQAAAEAQRAEQQLAGSPPIGSPLLTPIRCQRLSVMDPEGTSPFSDCCGTPLAESPFAQFLSVAVLGASVSFQPTPASPWAAAAQHSYVADGSSPPAAAAAEVGVEDEQLEEMFSDLMEETISGMLFDLPLPSSDLDAAAAAHAACCASGEPMSPTAVLREMTCDGCDSTDGSDCDAPMMAAAPNQPFTWPRSSARSVSTC